MSGNVTVDILLEEKTVIVEIGESQPSILLCIINILLSVLAQFSTPRNSRGCGVVNQIRVTPASGPRGPLVLNDIGVVT